MNLNTHRIVTLTLERLDLGVLLNPFEEQFDLSSVFVKECDVLGCKGMHFKSTTSFSELIMLCMRESYFNLLEFNRYRC